MSMAIEYGADRTLSAQVRGHEVKIRRRDGGPAEEAGPTPTDMFLFGLGGCVGLYAADYAERHGIATKGMKIEVDTEAATKPTRISGISFRITMPGEVPEKHRKALVRSASQCYLHKTLNHGPHMEVALN